LIDYKGRSYLFYHNGALPGGGGFTRSVCVDEFTFNADGSIPRVINTVEGVKPVGSLDPYVRQEAETIAWEKGVETETSDVTGVYVTDIDNGDYIKVRNVDFGKGAASFNASMAAVATGGSIEIRLDSLSGNLLGTCSVKNTGGAGHWETQSCKVSRTKGIHDVFFVFKGGQGDLFHFDWWKFNAR
jgi:hypothetical protein